MSLTLNVGIDFDHTLVNNNLHNAIVRELKKKNFPPGTTNSHEAKSAINSDNMSRDVKQWLDEVIKRNKIDFFNKETLQELLQNFRELDCEPFILTASSFPGAVKYMIKQIGQTDLANNVHSVPTLNASANKADYLSRLEIDAYDKGATSVATIFIDDSKANTEAINRLPKQDTTERFIVQVAKTTGLDKDVYSVVKAFGDGVVEKEKAAEIDPLYVNAEVIKEEAAKIDPLYVNAEVIKEEEKRKLAEKKGEAAEIDPLYVNAEVIKEEAAKIDPLYVNAEVIKEEEKRKLAEKKGEAAKIDPLYVNAEVIKEEEKRKLAEKKGKAAKIGPLEYSSPGARETIYGEESLPKEPIYANIPKESEVAIAAAKGVARRKQPIDIITMPNEDQTEVSRASIHLGSVTFESIPFNEALSAMKSKFSQSSPAERSPKEGATKFDAFARPQVAPKPKPSEKPSANQENKAWKPLQRHGAIKRRTPKL